MGRDSTLDLDEITTVEEIAAQAGLVHEDELASMAAEVSRPGGKPPELTSPRHRRLVAAIVAHSEYTEEELEYVSLELLEDLAADVVPEAALEGDRQLASPAEGL